MNELYWTDLLAIPILAFGVVLVRKNVRLRDFDLASVHSLGVLFLGVVWLIVIVVRVFGDG